VTTRDWALLYGRLGWRVFPVVPGGKRPLYRGWQRDATTDPVLIGRYWRREPGPNIGIVYGEKFDAFDNEGPHLERLKAWPSDEGHVLPPTAIARTGRGGVHILVQPLGIGGGRDLYLTGDNVGELKSVGGFVVACPSATVGPGSDHRALSRRRLSAIPARGQGAGSRGNSESFLNLLRARARTLRRSGARRGA
jgi:hypothetical protein